MNNTKSIELCPTDQAEYDANPNDFVGRIVYFDGLSNCYKFSNDNSDSHPVGVVIDDNTVMVHGAVAMKPLGGLQDYFVTKEDVQDARVTGVLSLSEFIKRRWDNLEFDND